MDPPDDVAGRAAAAAGVRVRPVTSLEEADEVVRLQRMTWGEPQLVPREVIRALQGAGVPPLGAFAESGMVGFVLGFLGAGPDGVHLHSHMLAVREDRQAAGVGRALKLAQRAWALGEGIGTIRWTFDPMIGRNAHFNLNVLGAVADRFHRHYYGDMRDRINAGERTDRLEVRWDLSREPGARAVAAAARVPIPPPDPAGDASARTRRRDRIAEALEAHLGAGLVAAGFDRERSEYLMVGADAAG